METEAEFLKNYDVSKYERPSVSVDAVIFTVSNKKEENYRKLPKKALKVLLIQRKNHPYKDQWALPGGFVDIDESLDDACLRELKEETNIDHIYMEQLYTYGDLGRDPRTRVISCSYMSLIDSTQYQVEAGDDAKEAEWFEVTTSLVSENKKRVSNGYILNKLYKLALVNEDTKLEALLNVTIDATGKTIKVNRQIVESNGIAFDHALIIHYGIERLRSKIEYTDIVFNLMPEMFTLTELQRAYEVILDRELLKANFRRKIHDFVIKTEEYTRDYGHRPSRLYKFNPNWAKM